MESKKPLPLAIKVFKRAVKTVPAYLDFLKKNKIDPEKINSLETFKEVPPTDKKNYIDRYPLKSLVWDGNLSSNCLINSSSGTTGSPYYWPLDWNQIQEGRAIHQKIYRDFFGVAKKKSLILICFGMGTWIAGTYTLLSTISLNEKLPITVMTPGFDKSETIKILTEISGNFDQIIIAGIPTFLKDLMDELELRKKMGLLLGKTRLLLSGEGISEYWREYMSLKIGLNKGSSDILSILGSAEAAIMGYETPDTIAMRKFLSLNKQENMRLFSSERIPTLAAFDEDKRYFESYGRELLVTAARSLPLIRYNIHDIGGTVKIKGIKEPMVYVFGRGKFTATIYAANIYPENITMILLDKKVSKYLSGRFILETKFNTKLDHRLIIHLERTKSDAKNRLLPEMILRLFMDKVPKVNSEFSRVLKEYGYAKTKPKVVIYENGYKIFGSGQTVKKLS